MTVSDLIDVLTKMPSDLNVWVHDGDGSMEIADMVLRRADGGPGYVEITP